MLVRASLPFNSSNSHFCVLLAMSQVAVISLTPLVLDDLYLFALCRADYLCGNFNASNDGLAYARHPSSPDEQDAVKTNRLFPLGNGAINANTVAGRDFELLAT